MSNELIFAEERQDKIISMLKLQNKLLVNDLCEQFSVSSATIRNDLNHLEQRGLLKRTHGGAISVTKTGFDLTVSEKEKINHDKKSGIARFAATLVENGDTIALDSGSTITLLAKELKDKENVTVITPDIKIASILENSPGITIVLAGGIVRKGYSCTTGTITNDFLSEYNVDKTFIATNAVTPFGELCTADIEQANVKKKLIQIGTQIILMCDSSKFRIHSFAKFGDLSDVDKIITDEDIDASILKQFNENNIDIEVV